MTSPRGIKRQLKQVAEATWRRIRQQHDQPNDWLEGYAAAIADVQSALDGKVPRREGWQDYERSEP